MMQGLTCGEVRYGIWYKVRGILWGNAWVKLWCNTKVNYEVNYDVK